MDRAKQIARQNVLLILLGVIIISLFVIRFIGRQIEYNKKYDSGIMNQEEIYYIEHKYEDNEYKVINIDEFDVINYYYRDFIRKLIDQPTEAWKHLTENNKKEMFSLEESEFIIFAKNIATVNTKNNKIEKYRKSGGKYTIIDSEDHMYLIEDDGVWNYKVTYLGQSKEYETK